MKRILQLPFKQLWNDLSCNLNNLFTYTYILSGDMIELQRRTLQDDRNYLVPKAQYLYFYFLVSSPV